MYQLNFSGLLDSFGTSEDIESCWTEDHLDCPSSNESFDRKISPPYITVLSDTKCRSGSDPTISRQPAIDQKKGSRSQENSITSPKSSRQSTFPYKETKSGGTHFEMKI